MSVKESFSQETKAPVIELNSHLGESAGAKEDFLESLESLSLATNIWQGAFKTNVWGGRYEIHGVMSKGGQGTTFHGEDRKTGSPIVIKVFDFSTASEWKKVELFDREVQTLKALNHHAVPQFVDRLENANQKVVALVMTRVPGRNFEDLLNSEGPLSEKELWRTLHETAEVLSYLHQEGTTFVHRDIKPRNLVVDDAGHVSLVDFGGVARAAAEGASTIVGTFGYMAPEQLYGSSTPASDIYALGTTLLKLATGKEPEDLPRDGLRILVDKAAPQLSAPLRTLLTRMTSADPKDRPANGKALLNQLSAIVSEGEQNNPKSGSTENAKSPHVDVKWSPKRSQDADHLISHTSGVVSIAVGMLGLVATVAIGDVILPLVFQLLKTFSSANGKTKWAQLQNKTAKGVGIIKRDFAGSIERGSQTLEEFQVRQKKRRMIRRKPPKKS
jgi:serine/threonine protein kinase